MALKENVELRAALGLARDAESIAVVYEALFGSPPPAELPIIAVVGACYASIAALKR